MKYHIKTKVYKDTGIITQELIEELSLDLDSTYAKQLATWVIATRDSDVRVALIELGWTPPPNKPPPLPPNLKDALLG